MRGKNQITDLAHRTMAAAGVRRMVACVVDSTDRISDCYRKAHMCQKRQIGNIVAHKDAFGRRDIEFCRQFFECRNFVLAALNDVCDAQFRHSLFNSNGLTTANDSYGYSGIKQTPHAETVLSIECFRFHAVVGQVEPTIGKYAVDIESDETYLL